jgi:hypothetical protein
METEEEIRVEIDRWGNKFYYNKKELIHRLDGPAIEWVEGSKEWYQNGELHRLDGPAVETSCGYKYWCQDGEYHRLDGPAMEFPSGKRYWYFKGRGPLHPLEWLKLVTESRNKN